MMEEKRTLKQNNSLHKWCEEIAKRYNNEGLTVQEIIKNYKLELFWTKESVKELLVHTAIKRMFGKKSTAELIKTGEIDKIIDVITRFNAELGIENIPFPSNDS